MFLILIVIICGVYIYVRISNCMPCVRVLGCIMQTSDTNKFENLLDFLVGVYVREL